MSIVASETADGGRALGEDGRARLSGEGTSPLRVSVAPSLSAGHAARPRGAVMLTPRWLFVLLAVVAGLVIVALSIEALASERANVLQQRRSEAGVLAQFTATYTARLYDQSSRVAEDVVSRLRAGPMSDAELHRYLKARAADTSADDYIVVLDANGRVRATSETERPVALDYGGPGFRQAWTDIEPKIVPMLRSRISGAVIYSYSRRLEDPSGRFTGVVGVNVKPEGIRSTRERKPESPILTLWGQDGRFVGASFVDFDAQGRAIAPPKPPTLPLPGAPKPDNGAEIVASMPVPGWPLVAAASFNAAGVLAEWRRHVFEAVVVVGFGLLGLGALAGLGVRTAEREAAALAERDLLMKEIHHRVKNSLAMTASLLYLKERRFKDTPEVREAFESTRQRLASIGLVHEALYTDGHPDQVDLSLYLPRLISQIADAYAAEARGVEVITEIEPVVLPAARATSVGLIVTEVLTNAFKHAFSGVDAGRITLRGVRGGLEGFTIEVRDNGAGYPTRVASRGLGSRLVAALADQLSGKIALATDNGAVFRLAFPI